MRIGSPTERQTAMVVEDCDELRYILVRLLARQGFDVAAYENAYDALCDWDERNAALVVTDLTLPHMSGVQFLNELRETNRLREAAVLIVTAAAELPPPLERAVVLTKPFAVAAFDRAVQRAIGASPFPMSAAS